VKTYWQLRDETRAAYLAHHETLWERLGFTSPWGHLRDEQTFNQVHAAVVRAVAQHGPFDTSPDYARHAFTGECRIVPDRTQEHGYRLCVGGMHIDEAAIIEGVIAAVIAIVITILCPPLAIFAGFLGTIIVGIALLVLANMAAEFVTGPGGASRGGASPEQHAAQLNQWAAESRLD
jgi:hypothetical protein